MSQKKKGEGLKQLADKEADKAEAESAEVKGKKADPPKIWQRTASQEDIARAQGVLENLKDRAQDMGPEGVVDGLLQVVDVHPSFAVPDQWPGKTDDRLLESPFLAEIGAFLIRGCPRLEVSPGKVAFLWRNIKDWSKNGGEVRAEAVKLSELGRFFTRGKVAAVVCNYRLFRYLNTRQKVAAIYSALRRLDSEGTITPVQFSGFFDELQLFGTGTNESDIHLVRAIEKGAARQLPFAFPPLSVGDPDAKDDDQQQARQVG